MSPIIYVLTTNGLLFLLSIIFWKFPPNKINNWYGYRTFKAMQNEDIWNFANAAFNKNLLMYAGFSFIAAMLLANFTTKELAWQPMVLALLAIVVSIIKTERALTDHFDEDGKRNNNS